MGEGEGGDDGSSNVGTLVGSLVVVVVVVEGDAEGIWSPQIGPISGGFVGATSVPTPQQSDFVC